MASVFQVLRKACGEKFIEPEGALVAALQREVFPCVPNSNPLLPTFVSLEPARCDVIKRISASSCIEESSGLMSCDVATNTTEFFSDEKSGKKDLDPLVRHPAGVSCR